MKQVWAIARLTFWEGIRMRVVLVFLVVLGILVLRMPFALRGDETLTGRLQNFLAYSLGALSVLLSLATIFFSCATLSNELKERSLHLVVTKPVSRLQILIGKWVGVNLLNILILLVCGSAIYGLAYFIRTRTPINERDRLNLRDTVWTAREAAKPVVPREEILEWAKSFVEEQIRTGTISPVLEHKAIEDRVKEGLSKWRRVENDYSHYFEFENMAPPEQEDTVIQVRFKVIAVPLPMDELVTIGWDFCDPDKGTPLSVTKWTRERSTDAHQFLVRAGPVIRDGRALLLVSNPPDPMRRTALLFDGMDSLQLLYKVGGFELNFVRALLIILLRVSLLSALGVFFSVFVSFPVACLCVCAFYVICLGMPFWLESVGAGGNFDPKSDPYGVFGPTVRFMLLPVLQVACPNFSEYDGTNRLVEGLYVSYALVTRCAVHTLLYGAALLLLPGWLIFTRREVAEVQV